MKKILKPKKFFTLTIIVISAILVHYRFGYSFVYIILNDNTREAKEYLENNYVELTDFSSIPILDANIEKHQLFLVGEEHGVGMNQDIQFKLLQYFNEKGGVKYVILEFPQSFATKINRYIINGEEAYLDSAFTPLKGTDGWTVEFQNFYTNIYNYNKTLIESEKIRCVGIDVEHQSGAAIKLLKTVLPNKEIPSEIVSVITKLQNAEPDILNHKSGWELANILTHSLQNNTTIYKTYLGDRYFEFHSILNNIANGELLYVTKTQKGRMAYNSVRDSLMYNNVIVFQEEFPQEKACGFWGQTHVFREKFLNTNFLAYYLDQNNPTYKGKVLSILFNYYQCKMIKRPDYKTSTYNGPFQNKIFDFYTGDTPTLFYLDKNDSPFQTFRFSPLYSCGTAKLVQYVLLIKNSQPSRQLSPKVKNTAQL